MNDSSPAAPSGSTNVKWQIDGSGNTSAYTSIPVEQDTILKSTEAALNFLTPIVVTDNPGNFSADINVPVFIASGASHKIGLVPDPGVSSGTAKFLREDATFALPAGTTYKVGGFAPGKFLTSQVVMYIPVDVTVNFVGNFAGSQAILITAPSDGDLIFLVNNGVTLIGNLTFPNGNAVGAFTTVSGTAKSLTAGQILNIVAPAGVDSAAAGLGFTLQGTH